MNTVELIINMACKIMERILELELKDVPKEREEAIRAAATHELVGWLREKDLDDKERVLTTFYITAGVLSTLKDKFPQLREHLVEKIKEEEEHGI